MGEMVGNANGAEIKGQDVIAFSGNAQPTDKNGSTWEE